MVVSGHLERWYCIMECCSDLALGFLFKGFARSTLVPLNLGFPSDYPAVSCGHPLYAQIPMCPIVNSRQPHLPRIKVVKG